MSNQINPAKKSLTIKDLVTTGIFSAIFLVFTMIGGIFFAPNPVLTFYMPMCEDIRAQNSYGVEFHTS